MGTAHGRCMNTEKSNTTLQTRANFPPATWQAISNALWELCCEAQIYPFPIISKHCWIICASCHFPNIITGVSFFMFLEKICPNCLLLLYPSACPKLRSKPSQNAASFRGCVPGLPALYVHQGCPESVSACSTVAGKNARKDALKLSGSQGSRLALEVGILWKRVDTFSVLFLLFVVFFMDKSEGIKYR